MLMRFDPFREMETMNQFLGRQSGRAPQVAIPMDAYREGDLLLAEYGWRSTPDHSAGNPFSFTEHLRGYLTDEQNALRFTASAGGR